MVNVADSARKKKGRAANIGKFGATAEYQQHDGSPSEPQASESTAEPASAETGDVPSAEVEAASKKSRKQQATSDAEMVRRSWSVRPETYKAVRQARAHWLMADFERMEKYQDISEQAFVDAILSVFTERIEKELKIDANEGLAGELESHVPANSMVMKRAK